MRTIITITLTLIPINIRIRIRTSINISISISSLVVRCLLSSSKLKTRGPMPPQVVVSLASLRQQPSLLMPSLATPISLWMAQEDMRRTHQIRGPMAN